MDETVKKPRVKYTSRVRRGLRDVRALVLDGFNADKAPSDQQVKTWTKPRQADFNLALDWIDQETQKDEKPVKDEVSREAPPPTAA